MEKHSQFRNVLTEREGVEKEQIIIVSELNLQFSSRRRRWMKFDADVNCATTIFQGRRRFKPDHKRLREETFHRCHITISLDRIWNLFGEFIQIEFFFSTTHPFTSRLRGAPARVRNRFFFTSSFSFNLKFFRQEKNNHNLNLTEVITWSHSPMMKRKWDISRMMYTTDVRWAISHLYIPIYNDCEKK